MPEINWMTILESQQDEFIIKLKDMMPGFTRGKYDFDEAIHLYSVCDGDDEKEEQMNWFCTELTYKYNHGNLLPDKFMNYKIGKIGEESVKQYLGKLISDVDYELYEWGDDGTDFYLRDKRAVSLQVKTTCFNRILEKDIDCEIDEFIYELSEGYVNLEHDLCQNFLDIVKWKISEKEQNKSQVCIFVLLLNQVVGDRISSYVDIEKIDKDLILYRMITNSSSPQIDLSYSSILCGFKPTDLLKPDTDIYLKDLFYIGGLKGYLKHFT
ncbi:MAG: hypothetical protein F6K54_21210 [Okeania sp. SIO3B5]|uniref:hypothetical protein n=1 Tax=Okeania sp. SIO3B5 TaxID=2607811 RepID=UPI0013FFAF23|nr:hypothetical protein [Okeania sp. SIO3B5]NEO55364.1 hypothetical protein [Okeania sp. SIO3B5]